LNFVVRKRCLVRFESRTLFNIKCSVRGSFMRTDAKRVHTFEIVI
jgi:hypothetical protein